MNQRKFRLSVLNPVKILFLLSLFNISATVFEGFEQADLNRGIKNQEIVYSPMDDFLYNEKWHFMALFDNGWALYSNVMITNIALERYSGGVEFSLYSPEGKIFTSKKDYSPEMVSASREKYQVRIAESKCGGEYPRYYLELSQDGIEVILKYENQVPGWKPGDGLVWFDKEKRKFFKYIWTSPRARVSGFIQVQGKRISVQGYGLQDYAKSNISASDYSTRWLHLRIWHPNYSVVYTQIDFSEKYGGGSVKFGVITDQEKIIYQGRNWIVEPVKYAHDAKYGKDYPEMISLKTGGEKVILSGNVKVERVLEKLDVFANLNMALRGIVYTFIAKPVFYRCQNQYQIELMVNGKKEILTGKGFNETVYIK